MSGNLGSRFGEVCKSIVKDIIVGAGVASGLAIGTSADSSGFADGGLLTGLGADIGKKVSTDMANRLREYINTMPDRVRYCGDPITGNFRYKNPVTPG